MCSRPSNAMACSLFLYHCLESEGRTECLDTHDLLLGWIQRSRSVKGSGLVMYNIAITIVFAAYYQHLSTSHWKRLYQGEAAFVGRLLESLMAVDTI